MDSKLIVFIVVAIVAAVTVALLFVITSAPPSIDYTAYAYAIAASQPADCTPQSKPSDNANADPANKKPPANTSPLLKSNPLPSGEVVNAASSIFCANSFTPGGQYPGVKNCTDGLDKTALYVEDDPSNDSAKQTWANSASANPGAIRAAYVAIGSASGSMKNVPTGTPCASYLANNGGCIDWASTSAAQKALGIITGHITDAHRLGANAIRLDEMDVCEDDNGKPNVSCQTGLNKGLRTISQKAASYGMGIVGNNSPNSIKTLIDEAANNGGATVLGTLVDASPKDMKNAISDMRSAIGPNIPIIKVQSK